MFSVIVVPLLRSLKWVNGYVGNYGWSIIILTIIINVIMFPLRHKSVVSMRKMQEIQPEVKAIQDRYAKLKATDPAKQKMNQEMMALYKERGVNPASGCVPMLLTFPVLFAFYALLSTSIELRGAPFFGWIHDLSAPDPLLRHAGADGRQPALAAAHDADAAGMRSRAAEDDDVHAGRCSRSSSSGRRRGWRSTRLVSNVWGIGQQYLTNYMIGPPNIRTVAAAGRAPGEARRRRQDRSGSRERVMTMPDTRRNRSSSS